MNIADIKKIAKKVGIEPAKLKKGELIKAIQTAEGNTPCFGSGVVDCPYPACCWRKDCIA